MKQIIILVCCLLLSMEGFANVNFIDVSKINGEASYESAFNYIKENQPFYEMWSSEWKYSIPKQDLIRNLRSEYDTFNSIKKKGAEVYLLLGDISHYLYNLDDTAFFSKAVTNYKLAIKESPKDYRGYWFLGYHYTLANVPTLAYSNFKKAEALLPADQPSVFWDEFASSASLSNMPSHCIYAMERIKQLTGTIGSFELLLGQRMRNLIEPVDKTQTYKKEDIWTATMAGGKEQVTFVCRPFGLKIDVDSTWGISVYDYTKGQAAFIVNPPALKNKNGREISYTIALFMKTAGDNERLDDYLNAVIPKSTSKKSISFSTKYDKMVAYEIIDKTMYQDMGGGHLYLIGVERNAPEFPGLLLESPVSLPQGNADHVSHYSAAKSKGRFAGKLFYAIMLDSCEEINEQSLAVLRTLFERQLVIE